MDKLVNDLLSGPVSVTYFPNVYGRNFYIFGDDHESFEDSCKSKESTGLINFLNKAFENTKVKIDFFIEAAFIKGNLIMEVEDKDILMKMAENYLASVIYNFADCLTPDKSLCNKRYDNLVRFHYVDIRQKLLNNSEGPTLSFFWLLNREYDNYILGPDTLENMLSNYMRMNTFDWAQKYVRNNDIFDEDDFMEAHELQEKPGVNRITKQLDAISNPFIKRQILKYYDDKSKWIFNKYRSLFNRINFQELENVNDMTDKQKLYFMNLQRMISIAEVLIMDIYLFGRIFKDSLNDSDEVWLYIGNHHASNVRKFLKDYLNFPKYYYSSKIPENIFYIQEEKYDFIDVKIDQIRCQDISLIKKGIINNKPICSIKADGTVICKQDNKSYKCLSKNNVVTSGKMLYHCKDNKCSRINEKIVKERNKWPGMKDAKLYDCQSSI